MSVRVGSKTADRTQAHTAACRAIQEFIFYSGGYCIKQLGGLGQRRGLPDITACVGGRAVYVEVKTGQGALSADQRYERERIERAGGIYILAGGVEDVERRLLAEGLVLGGLFG